MISLISNMAKTHSTAVSSPNQKGRGAFLSKPLAQDTFTRSEAKTQAQPSFRASLKIPAHQVPLLDKVNKLTQIVDELGEKHAEALEDELADVSEEVATLGSQLADHQVALAKTYLDLDPENPICMQNAFRLAIDATKLVPEHPDAHFICGILEGNPKDAHKHLTIAIKGRPKNVDYLQQKAYAADEAGYHRVAISDFTKLIELDPRNLEHRLRRGMLSANAGDLSGAMSDFDHVMKVAPHNYKGPFAKAYVLYNNKDYAEAARHYEKAIEKNPQGEDLAVAYCNLGSAHFECENFAPAIKAFTSSIELEPVPEIIQKRALSHMFLGNYDEAIKDAKTAQAAGLETSEPISLQVFSLQQMGRHDEADSLLTRAEDTFLEQDFDFRKEIDDLAKLKADFDAKPKEAQK